MSSREYILNTIRSSPTHSKEALQDVAIQGITFSDKTEAFRNNLELVGGKLIICEKTKQPADIVTQLFPEPKNILSLDESISGDVDIHNIAHAKDLENLEVTIVKGECGVAENGAIWIDGINLKFRSSLFICQHLVIILDESSIVNNLHEAYDIVNLNDNDYSLFISGPSKTADIEQSLVIGAHGPRSCTVILT
jgi:L-lactate dehydrogenase complex protein LldG